MRLGIFGGSFDPPHVGHLLAATDAAEKLGLDRLVFVPAAVQPLKAGARAADPEHRLAMVRAMVGDDGRFSVDPIEIARSGLSYTVETLAEYERRHPEAEQGLFNEVAVAGRDQAAGLRVSSTTAVTVRSPSAVVAATSRWPWVAVTQPEIREPAASVLGTRTLPPDSHGCRSVSLSTNRFGGNTPRTG